MRKKRISYDKEKLKQVLHYIIHQCGHLENVGKTVLFKILYFSDFNYYELHEKPLTGESYRKITRGPAPTHFDSVAKELESAGKIRLEKRKYRGYPQQKFLCLAKPPMDLLSTVEKETLDKAISLLSALTASQVSALSHGDVPVKATKDGEIIDYELVFYRDPVFSVREYND